MCLTEKCSRVWVGKNLTFMFPILNGLKQGDILRPLLFNFALEYAPRRVSGNPGWLEINWRTSDSGLCR